MRDIPILFSAPMVRAIQAGTKTQTRRAVKGWALEWLQPGMFTPEYVASPENHACPYGQPGDRLWVRETWAEVGTMDPGLTVYRADYPACVPSAYENVPPESAITWKPSIHMHRHRSRITLGITGVRVERLQDISEADAWAEGCIPGTLDNYGNPFPAEVPHPSGKGRQGWDCARDWYADLWEDINGPESWATNPWVWVVEFKAEA